MLTGVEGLEKKPEKKKIVENGGGLWGGNYR